jgi:hypothetical protein
MHKSGGNGTNEIRVTCAAECEHHKHRPPVARTPPDGEQPLLLLRVFDIRGDMQTFLAEKRFDVLQRKPVLLTFLLVPVVPIKPDNLFMSHTL